MRGFGSFLISNSHLLAGPPRSRPGRGCLPTDANLTGAWLPPDGAAATRVLRAAAQSAARFRRNPREHSLACLTLVGTAGAGGNASAMREEGGVLVPPAVNGAAFRRRARPAAV